mmetsp:Transcript_66758/g.204266  ORF Transcript_66758/g.204266 Transcript_66758/m.204266 type:complete len:332 (+) Transcript_66758:4216-5211(+)
MDVAAALLLGEGRHGQRELVGQVRADVLPLRQRVPGELHAPGHHAPDGHVLHHAHGRAGAQLGRRARRARRHRQDRDDEGPGQGAGEAVRRVQLLARDGLHHGRQILQGPRVLGGVVLLRRVQPDQHRGALSHRPAVARAFRQKGRARELQRDEGAGVRGDAHRHEAHLQRLHHHEPWLRRARGAAGQPGGALPAGGDDGARLRADRGDHVLRLRLHRRQEVGEEDGHHLHVVLRAAVVAVPLRLRHARREEHDRDVRQALPRGRRQHGRGPDHAPGPPRRERAEVPEGRLALVREHHHGLVPRHGAAGRRVRRLDQHAEQVRAGPERAAH